MISPGFFNGLDDPVTKGIEFRIFFIGIRVRKDILEGYPDARMERNGGSHLR